MKRTRLTPLCVLFGVVALLAFAPSAPAASGGACQLKGTASFGSGLSTTAKPFDYSFNGAFPTASPTWRARPPAAPCRPARSTRIRPPASSTRCRGRRGTAAVRAAHTNGTAVAFWADGTTHDRDLQHDRRGGRRHAARHRRRHHVPAPGEPADAPLALIDHPLQRQHGQRRARVRGQPAGLRFADRRARGRHRGRISLGSQN